MLIRSRKPPADDNIRKKHLQINVTDNLISNSIRYNSVLYRFSRPWPRCFPTFSGNIIMFQSCFQTSVIATLTLRFFCSMNVSVGKNIEMQNSFKWNISSRIILSINSQSQYLDGCDRLCTIRKKKILKKKNFKVTLMIEIFVIEKITS